MEDFFSGLIRAARRTAQPYRYTLRAASAYITLAVVILALLTLFRLTILASPENVPPAPAASSASSVDPEVESSGKHVAFFEYSRAVTDHLSSDLIVSIVVAALLLFVTTKHQDERTLATIEPWNIHPALLDPLARTKTYWFRGRSGRFLRDTVLPALNDNGKKESTQRTVYLLLPDPTDGGTMQRYSDYRNSLPGGTKEPWTAGKIRDEILATILKAAELSANNQFLEIHVSVSSNFALFRSDMSDERLIMTREEQKWPGLMCTSGSVFYESFLEEMRIAHRLGRLININNQPFGIRIKLENIASILTGAGIQISLSDEEKQSVLTALNSKGSPYA